MRKNFTEVKILECIFSEKNNLIEDFIKDAQFLWKRANISFLQMVQIPLKSQQKMTEKKNKKMSNEEEFFSKQK